MRSREQPLHDYIPKYTYTLHEFTPIIISAYPLKVINLFGHVLSIDYRHCMPCYVLHVRATVVNHAWCAVE